MDNRTQVQAVYMSFLELGLDSLTAMTFNKRITEATGIAIPQTALFEHPDLRSFAGFLTREYVPAAPDAAPTGTPASGSEAPMQALLAALGGVLSSARLASASQQAGTGDVNLNAIAAAVIGGTSLFGGRGSAWSALLGIIVIQSISNGLTLLNMSSSLRYMITGCVLAIAVIVDSLARQSRVSHGRA